MRLKKVERGQPLSKKLILWAITVVFRVPAPDVLRMLFYRPKFFGDPNNAWTQALLRGPSEWKVWERELFAAFTSKLNQCPF